MDIVVRTVYSLLTLYMLLILLRWFAPWIDLDLYSGRLRWISKVTDPLINRMRQLLPPMGPMDFGPLAALVAVWLVRSVAISLLFAAAVRSYG